MRSLMKSLGPTGFDDAAARVALYRPGLMLGRLGTLEASETMAERSTSWGRWEFVTIPS